MRARKCRDFNSWTFKNNLYFKFDFMSITYMKKKVIHEGIAFKILKYNRFIKNYNLKKNAKPISPPPNEPQLSKVEKNGWKKRCL